jgi:transcriptional regulator with XRE-family HTH domain
MTHFGQLLKEARKRARLTQQELAEKVGIHHSYISKMEKEDYRPSFDVAVELAEALGMSDDEEFLSAARPLKGFKLVKVEDSEAKEEEEEAISMAHPAIALRKSRVRTSREEFKHLISSAHLIKEDEEKVFAVLVEVARPILDLMKTHGGLKGRGSDES